MTDLSDLIAALPEEIPMAKLSASANDFIVLDNRNGIFSRAAGEMARRLCSRRYSVGADGLILIENSIKASFRVRFFNPDGKEFNTCGNGGRCAARFAFHSVITGKKMKIETNIGVIEAEVLTKTVKLQFVEPSKMKLNLSIPFRNKVISGHFVRLGDPHYVVYTTNLRDHPIVGLAREIRYHESFAPEGTNVHFIEPVSRQQLRIRSYERGIEDETLACGSGCVSAALTTFCSSQTMPPVTFEPQSGIPLTVHFRTDNGFQDIFLEGDARLIFEGNLTREALTGFPLST
jgi:diaminopimelate epimerase